jgi:hypothetical protein
MVVEIRGGAEVKEKKNLERVGKVRREQMRPIWMVEREARRGRDRRRRGGEVDTETMDGDGWTSGNGDGERGRWRCDGFG